LFFIVQKKLLLENMSHFNQLPEFEEEFSRLSKKFTSLVEDLVKFEKLVNANHTGSGKNFTIIHNSQKCKIVKARLACKSLRNRSMRIIYAYHNDTITFVYIEIYFKGEKENENKERIKKYIKMVE
jgi:hypothetical protein